MKRNPANTDSTCDDASIIPLRTSPSGPAEARVVAIVSGKGGVGKTNVAANLALALGRQGLRVLAVDADLGLANLDIVLGLAPAHTSAELIRGEVEIDDVLVRGPHNLWLLPGASGSYDVANLQDVQRHELISAIDTLEERFDAVVVDTGAGLSATTVGLSGSAQEIVLLATADPTGLSDARATLRVLHERQGVRRVKVLATLVRDADEGSSLFERLATECGRDLDVRLSYMGSIPFDPHVGRAVMRGLPVSEAYPSSEAALAFSAFAHRFLADPNHDDRCGSSQIFWRRLLRQEGAGQ